MTILLPKKSSQFLCSCCSFIITSSIYHQLLSFQRINAFQTTVVVQSCTPSNVHSHGRIHGHIHGNTRAIMNNKQQSYSFIPTTITRTPSSSSTAMNVKFKLDNDDDDNDDNAITTNTMSTDRTSTNQEKNNLPSSLCLENEDNDGYKTAPATTFGAEAVPEAQRPANEYMELLSSPLFGWANRQPNGDQALLTRLATLYVALFTLVCWPISGATFTISGYELHQFFSSNVGAIGFVLVIVLRLYTGWGYVANRLQSKEIEYEETGWYDGDIELKTDAEIARDLFLYKESVKPVVQRLQKFTIIIGALWIASCIGLNVAFQTKPMFNEYDPEMLKTLNYDDKIADVAAQQSNGRPTYCDNRYYRAVANGGQGC